MDENRLVTPCDPYTVGLDNGDFIEFLPCKTHSMVLGVWEKIHHMIEDQLKHSPTQSKSLMLNTLMSGDPSFWPFERLWCVFFKGRVVGFVHTRMEKDETEPPTPWLHLLNVYKDRTFKGEITKYGIPFLQQYVRDLRQIHNIPVYKIIAYSSRKGAEKLYPGYGFKKTLTQFTMEVE